MTNFKRLATVRTRFLQWLQDFGQHSEELGPDGSLIHRESMLIRDEFFCGRKFHAQHYTAVWFIEEDVLKIHHADGSLELVLRGSELDVCEPAERAVDAEHAATATELQVLDESTAEGAVVEDESEETSDSLEIEPRILNLSAARDEAEDLIESSAHDSDQTQITEQQTDGVDSGEQGSRKAA